MGQGHLDHYEKKDMMTLIIYVYHRTQRIAANEEVYFSVIFR